MAAEKSTHAGGSMGFPAYVPAAVRDYVARPELSGLAQDDRDCLRRLVHDARMREVYSLLDGVFTEDGQWPRFVYAAWAARIRFSPYREGLKRAKQLNSDIAKTAASLAGLLREIAATGVGRPFEFHHIPTLLEHTDASGRNWYYWPAARETLFHQYEWTLAPELAEALDTLADAARQFEPREDGFVGAALASRKSNPKTEYLRAFGELLTEVHGFRLTTPIMKATAVTATVVLNDPNLVVTYDDVRKALNRLGGEPLEDSSGK